MEMADGTPKQGATEREGEWRLRIDRTGGSFGWPYGDAGNMSKMEQKPGDAATAHANGPSEVPRVILNLGDLCCCCAMAIGACACWH